MEVAGAASRSGRFTPRTRWVWGLGVTHYYVRIFLELENHNILSTAPQLSISQKALDTLPDDGNVIPKHVGDTIHTE
jgi:hypothetical protein